VFSSHSSVQIGQAARRSPATTPCSPARGISDRRCQSQPPLAPPELAGCRIAPQACQLCAPARHAGPSGCPVQFERTMAPSCGPQPSSLRAPASLERARVMRDSGLALQSQSRQSACSRRCPPVVQADPGHSGRCEGCQQGSSACQVEILACVGTQAPPRAQHPLQLPATASV